jgi:hypothetical protein
VAPEGWTTVTTASVRVGDRVHIDDPHGRRMATVISIQALPAGGRRLFLDDGTRYDMPPRGSLQAYRRNP